jgi:predicted lactoylglutathione lyase
MKKQFFMIVAAGLLLTTALTSCKKEEVKGTATKGSSKPSAMLKTAQEEEDYYDDMIRTVSFGIADLSTNTTFRQTVSDLVALQFDGDDNIPLVILDSVLAVNGINLKQEMINSLTAHNKQSLVPLVTQAVDGFEYFGSCIKVSIK